MQPGCIYSVFMIRLFKLIIIEMEIKKLLNSHGLKAGKVRLDCLELILKSKTPLSAVDILEDSLMQGVSKSTVYRNLEDLMEVGIIDQVASSSDSKLYEIKTKHHHHHFSCTDCGWVECVDVCELEKHLKAFEQKMRCAGMDVRKHLLGFEGLCNNCK